MKRVLPFLLTLTHCQRMEVENRAVLQELYKRYQNGEISECRYNGQLVYSAGINAYDAGGVIYDQDGKPIASCNYAWGLVDPICRELTNCEIIYRVKNHITGQPPVNKYRLK